MKKIQSVRGTVDLFSEETRKQNLIIKTASKIASLYGFEEVSMPILEMTEVFSRPLGQSSDVVSKETYTFNDRGGESLTLRPEGTAGIMRAVISNGKAHEIPLKYFYSGPMFRYERPQMGRLRQFNQIGIEFIGNSEPLADAEVIICGVKFLKSLNLLDKCNLNINTLGDIESRSAYRNSIVEYFSKYYSSLSEFSKKRLSLNPLRILDSKEKEDKEIILEAPLFSSYLNYQSKEHFEKVLDYLNMLKITYFHDEKLVRGLDYYCHTTFEFITKNLGSQGTVLGGGRYDGLSETLNGPKLAGVGFAAGVERLALLYNEKVNKVSMIGIIPMEDDNIMDAYVVMNNLRGNNFSTEMFFTGNLNKKIKKSVKRGIKHVIFVGSKEYINDEVLIKNLENGKQWKVSLKNLIPELKNLEANK